MAQRISRRAVVGTAVTAVVAGRPFSAKADPAVATVVSTDQVSIVADPSTPANILATAPLGSSVILPDGLEASDIPDGPVFGQYLRVEYNGTTGFAQDYFLAVDPTHVPYLLQGEEGCQRIALIFNVGVGQPPAEGILDTLRDLEVPATMFVMGWWVEDNPPIFRRMVDEGYVIGSHGYDSIELPTRSDAEVAQDVRDALAAIERVSGQPMTRIFTPYASAIDERTRAIVAQEGQLPVGWEVYTADYQAEATGESVYNRVMEGAHDGAIVELHLDAINSAGSTALALPLFVRDLRAEGYRFVTVPEMMQGCPSAA